MITLNMMVVPGGVGFLRFDCLSGSIHTTDCGQYHAYHLVDANDVVYQGRIPKVRSGHRNPFHLLGDIADQVVKQQDDAILAQIDGDDQ